MAITPPPPLPRKSDTRTTRIMKDCQDIVSISRAIAMDGGITDHP